AVVACGPGQSFCLPRRSILVACRCGKYYTCHRRCRVSCDGARKPACGTLGRKDVRELEQGLKRGRRAQGTGAVSSLAPRLDRPRGWTRACGAFAVDRQG